MSDTRLGNMLDSLARVWCRVFGHTHDGFVETMLDGQGYTITLYCQRCGEAS